MNWPVTVLKLSTHADPTFTTPINHTKESKKMSHPNYTGYQPDTETKKFVPHIGAVGGPMLLKALEGLGLLNHSPTLHQLVASGQAQVGALGQQWTVYEVDQALAETTASVSVRMTFKSVLQRHGLLKKNLY